VTHLRISKHTSQQRNRGQYA